MIAMNRRRVMGGSSINKEAFVDIGIPYKVYYPMTIIADCTIKPTDGDMSTTFSINGVASKNAAYETSGQYAYKYYYFKFPAKRGNKYYFYLTTQHSPILKVVSNNEPSYYGPSLATPQIYKSNITNNCVFVSCVIKDEVYDNFIFRPVFIDITNVYGEGKEPTLTSKVEADFKKTWGVEIWEMYPPVVNG